MMSFQLRLRRNAIQQIPVIMLLACGLLIVGSPASEAAPPSVSPLADAPLADAIENGEQTRIDDLLRRARGVNAAQPDGTTPLHWAAYRNDLGLARRLLAAGAQPQTANQYGVRPLSLACLSGNEKLIRLLLEKGADPNSAKNGGETPLMTAARTGKVGAVRALIASGAKVDARERQGQTALMWAAAEGHAEVVQALLDAKADFRTPLASGFTPFFFAVRSGRIETVQRLLRAGCDVNAAMRPTSRPPKGPRPGTAALILAVENGHFDLAEVLLKAGANPNDQRSGYTPLHALTWVRKPNRGDGPDGDPPPIGSGKQTSLQFVTTLLRHGADINARLKKGRSGRGRLSLKGATPFLMAAKTADLPLLKQFVKLGADPRQTNADQCTPLLAAAGIGTIAPGEEAGTEEEAVATVQWLLGLGAEINHVDRNGETAMHGAAYKSLPKMVALLAARGANPRVWNRKNKYGWTPLRIAQGYRPGNFKPSAATIAALQKILAQDAR